MKILLINANWALNKYRYTMSVLNPYKITPLELCYIAGGIDSKNVVEIYDAFALEDSWIKIEQKIKTYIPDVCVVTTAPTYLFWRCCPLELSIPKKLISIIKKISASKVILIGPHGSITPQYVLGETNTDILIKGEGDLVVANIINQNFRNIKDIPGVCTQEYISSQLAIVEDLNSLPIPKLDILDLKLYEPHIWVKKLKDKVQHEGGLFILAEASRGCPKRCVFCQREFFRKTYREKSAKRMKKEIDFYKKLGVKYVYFIDETGSIFTEDKKQWLEYLGHQNIKFGVEAIIDQTTTDVIDRFAKAGCIYLEYGLETLDKDLHKMMMKNFAIQNLDYAKRIIDTVVCFELNFYSYDYINLLGIKDVKQEALFNRPIIPYPGSPLGRMLLSKYKISETGTWDFVLRYTWWLQVEYFFIENDIKRNGFKKEIFFKPYKSGIKEIILNSPLDKVRDLVYALLDLSSFWEKNSPGFRDK